MLTANLWKGSVYVKKESLWACLAACKKFMDRTVNCAALRLLYGKPTDTEIREALDWEKEHR